MRFKQRTFNTEFTRLPPNKALLFLLQLCVKLVGVVGVQEMACVGL